LKKVVLILRSVNNIVIALAKTGKDKTNKKVVMPTLQINKDNRSIVIPFDRIFKIVLIKLIEPIIEEAPAK
jgi:hypothetical protein